MNVEHEAAPEKPDKGEPLFASPWIALFLVIRRELFNSRRDS